uniref:Spectrin repeat-containing domain protein n=1 Tax=Macrostomum lignano TaxID=282301 RepID=A0A1I8G3X7_9PLAT
KLQQLLESEQCSLADAQVAFEKLRSAKNCPGKVHRQFKKLQQASDEYVEQLQQALNRRRSLKQWTSGLIATENSAGCNPGYLKLLDSINALESKFNGWQKLKEEFSDFLYDDNLTSRYKSLQDTAQVVGDMRRSVSLQNVFDSHVAEFQSWLDQQELRIGAVLNKPDNEICLRPFADDPDIEEAEEKLKELKHIEKFFNQTETYWLMNTHSNGRALIDSCRQNANLQRETESRISAMDSLCKQVKSLTEETDARKGDFELLLQLEIGKRLAQSDELNAVFRKGIEKLYGKLKVQLESKKKIADRHNRMCKKLAKFNYLTDKAKSWMKKCHQKLDELRNNLNTVPVEERDVMKEVKDSIRKRLEVRQQLQEADSRLKDLETLFNDLSRQKKVLLNEQVQQVNELK